MLTALALILGLLVVSFVVLYRRALRECTVITEFTQFLLLNAESYADHRRKFLDYLAGTGQNAPTERGRDAQRVIQRMAASLFDRVLPGNAAARNAIIAAASKPLTP